MMEQSLLSKKLEKMASIFDARRRQNTALTAKAVATLADEFALLGRLARSMEQELAVHRLGETDRLARHTLETAASETLEELALDPEGKVVRPIFGRRQ